MRAKLLLVVIGLMIWPISATAQDLSEPTEAGTEQAQPDNDLQPTQPMEIEAPLQADPVHRVQMSEEQGPSVQQMVVAPTSEPSPRAPILVVSDMSFQAKVTPLVDGAHTLDFFIYGTSVGGAILDSVLNVPVTSTDGVISTTFAPTLSIFDGSRRYLAFTIDDVDDTPLGTEPRQLMAAVPYAARVDYVGSEELDDNLSVGEAGTNGSIVAINTTGTTVAEMSAFNGGFQTWQTDGDLANRLYSFSWGQLLQYDSSGTNTVQLNANASSGGELRLLNDLESIGVETQADLDGGRVDLYGSFSGINLQLSGLTGSGVAEDFWGLGTVGGALTGSWRNSAGGAQLFTYDDAGALTGLLGSSASAGGFIQLYQADGSLSVILDGDAAGANNGAVLTLANATDQTTVNLDGDDGDGGARLTLRDGTTETIRLDGSGGGGGAGVSLFNSAGTNTIELDADETDSGVIRVLDSTTNATIELQASEGGSPQILMRDSSGAVNIELDSDWAGSGESRIRTDTLEIEGGADLSEHFDVCGEFRPGMVVSIDPENPGMLSVCTTERDRRVAGIVSGGRNIRPGLLMGQAGTRANGSTPIALTGRVWCYASTSNGIIQPGDFLTTSNTPGYCMKVRDMDLAQGAIIGKAMTSVENGMVLVLVNLQ